MINLELSNPEIDASLGLDVPQIETELLARARAILPSGNHHLWGEAIHEGNQTWVGLHPETIQTPYLELKEICDLLCLKPKEKVVDLGASYGRLGFILASFYPEISFLGVEYVPERVKAGALVMERLPGNIELIEGDLTDKDFQIPEAQYYFIYDFGKVAHIRETLQRFSLLADKKRFKLIARGKGIRSLIGNEFPWLIEIHSRENFSIFQG